MNWQAGQAASNGVPQAPQNRALRGLSCWHEGQLTEPLATRRVLAVGRELLSAFLDNLDGALLRMALCLDHSGSLPIQSRCWEGTNAA
jgi:hypothetical protein